MKKKTAALALSVILVLSVAAGGTMAYLTGTGSAKNVFTVGEITATLDEAKVDATTGLKTDSTRVEKNTYPIIPGHTVDKDPTVHIKEGSLPCYVFVCVTDELNETLPGSASYTITSDWTKIGVTADGDVVYQYSGEVNAASEDKDLVVFNGLTYNYQVVTGQNINSLDEKEITVSGYVHQSTEVSADTAKTAALTFFDATAT